MKTQQRADFDGKSRVKSEPYTNPIFTEAQRKNKRYFNLRGNSTEPIWPPVGAERLEPGEECAGRNSRH